MKIQILTGFCFLTSAVCLLAGYCMADLWFIWWVLLLLILPWVILRKKPGILPASLTLIEYLVLVATGILSGLSSYLMIVGCASALACWDLVLYQKDITGNPALPKDVLYEQIHLITLATAISLGLFLSILSLHVHIRLPFGLIAGLALLAAFGVFQGFRSLMKKT